MIEFIIGLSAFLFGEILGSLIGATKALSTFLTMLGIPEEKLAALKNDIKSFRKRVTAAKPKTEEEKEKFRGELFDILTKYSKYTLKGTVCVNIAHED